jgi:nitrogen fixation protein NifX
MMPDNGPANGSITGLRIAVATTDGTLVDEHFGRCVRFDVYDLDAAGAELTATRELGPALSHEEGAVEDRLAAVLDCAIVHVTSIGPGAAARVVNAGIMPLKVTESTPVADVLTRLQAVLAGSPPPWLRKLVRRADPAGHPTWTPS